jgi:hypothetical protein
MCVAQKTEREREREREREIEIEMYWEKKKVCWGKRNVYLEVSVKYFGTKF